VIHIQINFNVVHFAGDFRVVASRPTTGSSRGCPSASGPSNETPSPETAADEEDFSEDEKRFVFERSL
jgi:hypothetical protein